MIDYVVKPGAGVIPFAVIEHETACMQFVMHVDTGIRRKASYP